MPKVFSLEHLDPVEHLDPLERPVRMTIRGLLAFMIVAAVVACEEFMGPSRPSRPARPLAPMLEVEVRRFDTLEWPLSQRRIQLPEKGILESFARLLRLPTGSGPVTGIEIRDFTEWNALWSTIAPGDSARVSPPYVDFPREMVYVAVAQQRDDSWPVGELAIVRVMRSESRYSLHTTTWLAADTGEVPALVDVVVLPAVADAVTLFHSGPMPPRMEPVMVTKPAKCSESLAPKESKGSKCSTEPPASTSTPSIPSTPSKSKPTARPTPRSPS